jgi:hypothetical protein
MPRGKATNGQAAVTTVQRLGALIKSCRDIMRKDKGLNGDLDRLPMLTWILFLKFLDDMEQVREDEAILPQRHGAGRYTRIRSVQRPLHGWEMPYLHNFRFLVTAVPGPGGGDARRPDWHSRRRCAAAPAGQGR